VLAVFAGLVTARVPAAALQSTSLDVSSDLSRHSRIPIQKPAMDAESSFELLARVRQGDADALNRLLHRYVPSLRKWARGRLPRWARDLAETEDLVQDAVFRSLQRIETFEYRHEGALQAYLREAVLNRIRDECRRVGRRPLVESLDDQARDAGQSPLEAVIGAQAVDRYEAGLSALRAEDREAIVARIEMGYSYAELAVMLGKASPDAARMAVSRALVRLAEIMRRGR
jgi:RNA polymerase sigma factor (sigma-70 family)